MSVKGITESTKPSEGGKVFVTSDENIEKQSVMPQLKQLEVVLLAPERIKSKKKLHDPTKTEKKPTVVDPRYLLSRLLFNYAE